MPTSGTAPQHNVSTVEDLIATLRLNTPDRFEISDTLLTQGVNINGRRPFYARYIVKSGPVIPYDSLTALYDAAERGDYEGVVFLLARGADVYKRIRTCTGAGVIPHPPPEPLETLCALDAMRTSKESKIVEVAERLYGLETKEEYIRRRDAFDSLFGYYIRNSLTEALRKPPIRRVKSVLKPRRLDPSPQQRYNLRTRK